MQIHKTFHWYAAHRNETLNDQCAGVHGHTYYATLCFEVERDVSNPCVSTLFSSFDYIEGWIKANWDHALFVHKKDPLADVIAEFAVEHRVPQKLWVMDRPSSVENLCFELFSFVAKKEDGLHMIKLQETTTSTVVYTRDDFEKDKKLFNTVVVPCECVIDASTKRCVICGRSDWDWKVEKVRRKNESAKN